MRSIIENLLMSVGTIHTINERKILKRIRKMNDWLSSFMMNQAIPYLGTRLCLINNKNSNHRRQPRIDTTFTIEWMTGTWMSQYIKRVKKALDSKQRHPMTMEHQKRGTYISNQVRMHACHLTSKHCTHIFYSFQEHP
jgi:hypothetical protein